MARRLWRGLIRWLAPVLVALAGAAVGIMLAPATTVEVGPLTATIHLRPSLDPRTVILLPPAGEVAFETHTAPVTVEARVQGVDITKAEHLLYDDGALRRLERSAPEAISDAAIRDAAANAAFAMLGAGIAVGLSFRRVRRAVIAGGCALGVTAASCGMVAVTFRPEALYQPQFEGLLSQAAYVADVSHTAQADYASYRKTLTDFVGQVSALYIAADSLPGAGLDRADMITVLHVSDIHDNPQAFDVIRQLSHQFQVDLVIDTGDIVSWGTPWESSQLTTIGTLGVPYVFVAGNHDGQGAVSTVAAQPNATVLSNQVTTIQGLTIAGIGDPRFAADDDSDSTGFTKGKDAVIKTVAQLGATITEYDRAHPQEQVDLALVHDPTQPAGLEGRVPLVLSGHMHKDNVQLDRDGSGTDWLTVGSTGGALASGGVRPVADGGKPLDLDARLLYFDRSTHRLVAYDDVTMGGLGLVSVSIQRHQMPDQRAPLRIPDEEDESSPSTPADPALPSVAPGKPLPDSSRVTDAPTPTPTPSATSTPATTPGGSAPSATAPPATAPAASPPATP